MRRPVATCQLKYFERNQATFRMDVGRIFLGLSSSKADPADPSHRSPFASNVPLADGIVMADGRGHVVDSTVRAQGDPHTPQSLASGMRGRAWRRARDISHLGLGATDAANRRRPPRRGAHGEAAQRISGCPCTFWPANSTCTCAPCAQRPVTDVSPRRSTRDPVSASSPPRRRERPEHDSWRRGGVEACSALGFGPTVRGSRSPVLLSEDHATTGPIVGGSGSSDRVFQTTRFHRRGDRPEANSNHGEDVDYSSSESFRVLAARSTARDASAQARYPPASGKFERLSSAFAL